MYDRDARRSAEAPVGRGAPSDDVAGMPADAIRRLQQSAGNHAVAALLDHRAPAQVMRLGTGEHAQLGGNRKVTINGVAMTEGEVITLGDFYANPDRIYEEKTPELQHLVDLIRQDRQYKEGVQGVAKVKQSQWENATRKHAPGETCQQLAFANDTRYGPDSRTEEQRKDDQADIFRGHMTNANFLPSGERRGTTAPNGSSTTARPRARRVWPGSAARRRCPTRRPSSTALRRTSSPTPSRPATSARRARSRTSPS